MKKLLTIAFVFFLVFAITKTVLAKNENAQGPHQKATGSVIAYAGSTRIDLTFNAHDTDPVKGDVSYSNSTGKYFLGNVDGCYLQDENKAVFGGTVMDNNYPAGNEYFLIEVWDKGEGDKAEGPDVFRVRLFSSMQGCVISGSFPGIVAEGNLQVHRLVVDEPEPPLALAFANGDTCTQIKDEVLTYSAGHYLEGVPLSIGYDSYGYNYQAHLFVGYYANVYLGGGGFPPYEGNSDDYLSANPGVASQWYWPYRNTWVLMKWNDAWLANTDCGTQDMQGAYTDSNTPDGKLDRHYGFDSYIGSGAWETNHMWDSYDDNGEMYDWNYFTKIVAAPADAYEEDGIWYTADGVEIGPVLWGEFATILEVYNDQGTGEHGVLYKSPVGPGFGKF